MTLTELNALIGRRGSITTLSERLTVPVIIRDVRQPFGRVDVLVACHAADHAAGVVPGESTAWVTLDRVRMEE